MPSLFWTGAIHAYPDLSGLRRDPWRSGAINIVLLVLGEALARYSPVELRAVGTLTEALTIFGVGAGIYVLSPAQGKSHH